MPAYSNNPYQYPPYYGHQQYGQPQQYTHHQQNQPQYIQQYSQPPYVQPPQNQPLYIQQPQHTSRQGNIVSTFAGRIYQSHNTGPENTTLNGTLLIDAGRLAPARYAKPVVGEYTEEVQALLGDITSDPRSTVCYDSSDAGDQNETYNGSFLTVPIEDYHSRRQVWGALTCDPSHGWEATVQAMRSEPSAFVTKHNGRKNDMWNGCRDAHTSPLYRQGAQPFYFKARSRGSRNVIRNGLNLSFRYDHLATGSSGFVQDRHNQTFNWMNEGGKTYTGA
ncbi:hypothetical protein VNI00_012101 [Paramarasmius palmivorus]|uniref:Uncharacterized protein n=1 Tax=Paramarasmius palmivorus TaxID=297713 RepID=A0AAW0C7X5_9AGAR